MKLPTSLNSYAIFKNAFLTIYFIIYIQKSAYGCKSDMGCKATKIGGNIGCALANGLAGTFCVLSFGTACAGAIGKWHAHTVKSQIQSALV